ncbi:MAG: hypothetical protein ACLFV8_12670 [Alphaproteobacteria bacterium]
MKPTPAQRKALRMIAEGRGQFHRFTGDNLERLGLAVPLPSIFHHIVGCNARFAADWRLTEAGEAALR